MLSKEKGPTADEAVRQLRSRGRSAATSSSPPPRPLNSSLRSASTSASRNRRPGGAKP